MAVCQKCKEKTDIEILVKNHGVCNRDYCYVQLTEKFLEEDVLCGKA